MKNFHSELSFDPDNLYILHLFVTDNLSEEYNEQKQRFNLPDTQINGNSGIIVVWNSEIPPTRFLFLNSSECDSFSYIARAAASLVLDTFPRINDTNMNSSVIGKVAEFILQELRDNDFYPV